MAAQLFQSCVVHVCGCVHAHVFGKGGAGGAFTVCACV